MKKYLKFLTAAVLTCSIVVISACSDDEGGGTPIIPPDPIKSITLDNGEDVETWEFTYDEEGRVSEIAMTYNDEPDGTREYDYSVAGKLTITRNGGSPVTYDLDSEDRVVKEPGCCGIDWYVYEYNSDGFLTKIYEHYDGADHLKWEMTVQNGNVTHRIQYEDDGTTVREDREFTYTIGDNASQIHQIYSVDSEWKWVGGVYGKQSKKLADEFVRHITADPTSTYGAEFDYDFDEKDRPATVTKTGTSSGGSYTEIFTYTYYEADEE